MFTSSTRSPTRIGQIALGLIWIVDGLLKLQPYFFTHFVTGVIDPSAAGQPVVIGHPITWIGRLIRPDQAAFVVLAVVGELSIGVCLLIPRTVKPALLISFAWALNVWLTGEGLGFLFTGVTPTPLTGILGTAPLYIIAGLLVWPRTARDADGQDPGFGLLGPAGARVTWAALWLGAAVFWLFPANAGRDATSSALSSAPSGAGWLSSLHTAAANLVNGSGMTVAVLLAVISAEIGLCVLWGRGTRIALIASMAVSLVFWFLAEGLGGLFTGQATDVGTGPLMILIAVLSLPLAARPAEHLNKSLLPGAAGDSKPRWEITGA
ncbi:MAG TPA: hypothetical protein VMF57_06365 [Solirubrobacteraceae bacterium]|nr:hypothetical protein [Solirubrobacteraceae bacterium]